MHNLDDTQPNMAVRSNEVPAPPRLLFWGVIGVFVLGIAGALIGIYIFREVLEPRYQQSVMHRLPFMEVFLPPRPDADDTLPTTAPVSDDAALGLLGPLETNTPTPTVEVTAETTPEITPEATAEPSATATATASPTAEPTQAAAAATSTPPPQPTANTSSSRPPLHLNTGFTWDRQNWNNCGPATVTTALSFYGWTRDQEYAASYLRPNEEDKNVSPHELVDFVNTQTDLNAVSRMGGDLDLLRDLVAAELPVIVEIGGYLFEAYDWIGHYVNVVGYDDSRSIFYTYDSFLGIGDTGQGGYLRTYDELEQTWRAFNYTFIVIYTPQREAEVMDILGERADARQAAEIAHERARTQAAADRSDPFAWFNLGTSLTTLGRYEEAANAFDLATNAGVPWRMLWYQFAPFEAYYNVGRYQDVLTYAQNNLENGGQYVEETYYWQGRALAALGQTQEARTAFRNALRRNRNYDAAQEALDRLDNA